MKVGVVALHDMDYGLDVANLLAEAGDSVSLYLNHKRAALALGDDVTEERFYELDLLPRAVKVHLYKCRRMRDPRNLLLARKIQKVMQSDGVEIVHLLVGQGDLIAVALAYFLKKIPVVSTMIVPVPNLGEALPSYMTKVVYRILAFNSDMVIVNGENQVELVKNLYHVPLERLAYVPLGTRQVALKWAQGQQPEEPGSVLFFGRADLHKGLELNERYL